MPSRLALKMHLVSLPIFAVQSRMRNTLLWTAKPPLFNWAGDPSRAPLLLPKQGYGYIMLSELNQCPNSRLWIRMNPFRWARSSRLSSDLVEPFPTFAQEHNHV